MFSKFLFFKISCVALFALSFWSCSNDHEFIEEDLIVRLSYDSRCLSEIGDAAALYAEGQLKAFGINKNFECVTDAIDYVQIRVKGKNEGVYSAVELKNFLNRFLFSQNPKTEDFYVKLLELKSEIVGGESDELSFKDLVILKNLIKEAQVLALKLQPISRKLFFTDSFDESHKIENQTQPLFDFLKRWITFQNKNFNITTLLIFIDEVGLELKAPDSWLALFNLLRGKSADQKMIFDSDKSDFVDVVQDYYTEAHEFFAVYKLDWELQRADFYKFHLGVEGMLHTIKRSLISGVDQKWSDSDLQKVFNLVSVYELFGKSISIEVQNHILSVLFDKVFPNETNEVDLNPQNFSLIEDSWGKIRSFISESESLEGHKGTGFPLVIEGDDPFSQFTQRRWPSLVTSSRTVEVSDFENEVEFSFQSLFHVSWQFLVAELLVDSYKSTDESLSPHSGINLEQVKEAYLDAFVFLKEVDFLGEESRGSWFRIFNEGNLFVPSAQPDEFVSFSETADYVAYMFSAYNAGSETRDLIKPRCPSLSEDCSFALVKNEPDYVFRSQPGLWDYFTPNLKKKSYERWQSSFEYIAKLIDDDSPYETSHWFRGTVATQYTEVIYRKYDLDFSDTLSFEEVSLAYIDFKEALKLLPMVRGTDAENNDAQLKSVLTYFVKNGKAPRFRNGKPAGPLIRHVALCGGVMTSNNRECSFESERSKIMSLLAYLTKISDEL